MALEVGGVVGLARNVATANTPQTGISQGRHGRIASQRSSPPSRTGCSATMSCSASIGSFPWTRTCRAPAAAEALMKGILKLHEMPRAGVPPMYEMRGAAEHR
jgi:hypothetical protein